jgi:hypothetical protein
MDVASIFQSLAGEDIFSFRIQPMSSDVNAFQIAHMNFPAGSLSKIKLMIILDTNVLPAIVRPTPDRRVVAWFDKQPRTSVWITSVTVLGIHHES